MVSRRGERHSSQGVREATLLLRRDRAAGAAEWPSSPAAMTMPAIPVGGLAQVRRSVPHSAEPCWRSASDFTCAAIGLAAPLGSCPLPSVASHDDRLSSKSGRSTQAARLHAARRQTRRQRVGANPVGAVAKVRLKKFKALVPDDASASTANLPDRYCGSGGNYQRSGVRKPFSWNTTLPIFPVFTE